MTENIYFDTDCISSFLWVNREDVLIKLYSGRMVIPKPVFDELSNPTIPHIKQKIDNLIKKGHADLVSIYIDSEAYTLYQKLLFRMQAFPQSGREKRLQLYWPKSIMEFWQAITLRTYHPMCKSII